jgi:hypothetical protein
MNDDRRSIAAARKLETDDNEDVLAGYRQMFPIIYGMEVSLLIH